jgi:hypothetical protein
VVECGHGAAANADGLAPKKPSLANNLAIDNESRRQRGRAMIGVTIGTGLRVVTFDFNSGDDSALDRVSSLSFTGATVAAWQYFGLASVAESQYDAGAINSTLASGSSYPGLDLFGRIRQSAVDAELHRSGRTELRLPL